MIKLIALDMDGTALTSRNEITKGTCEAVKAAREQGVKVILSTGRIVGEAAEFAREMGADREMISSGGAAISDAQTVKNLVHWRIPLESSAEAVRCVQSLPLTIMIYVGEKLYINGYSDGILSARKRNEGFQQNKVVLEDIAGTILKEQLVVNKIFARSQDAAVLQEACERVRGLPGIRLTSSASDNIELMPVDADKGAALRRLCADLQIPLENVMAIGDSDNDRDMLLTAGLSVVMANGDEKTRALADYITDSNDDEGVRNAIYRFIRQ